MTDAVPRLIAALMCERVLREADGVNSLIRVVDSVRVAVTAEGDTGGPIAVPLTLFIALRGGSFRGQLPFRVVLVDEHQRIIDHKAAMPTLMLNFTDAQPDTNIAMMLTTPFPGTGRFVFKIFLGDTIVGESPFTLTPVPLMAAQAPTSA